MLKTLQGPGISSNGLIFVPLAKYLRNNLQKVFFLIIMPVMPTSN